MPAKTPVLRSGASGRFAKARSPLDRLREARCAAEDAADRAEIARAVAIGRYVGAIWWEARS